VALDVALPDELDEPQAASTSARMNAADTADISRMRRPRRLRLLSLMGCFISPLSLLTVMGDG
jgi:hypothetical protein